MTCMIKEIKSSYIKSKAAFSLMSSSQGMTLIEVILTVIIMGILATIALRVVGTINTAVKTEKTKTELEALAYAIAGNPALQNNGVRTDFGYVGDIGALPPNLDALVSNPGGYSTWRGPYFKTQFSQITDEHKRDAWGELYSYNGGVAITSSGKSGGIVKRVINSTSDLLLNQVSGTVLDLDGSPPGNIYKDSLLIRLFIPDGAGSITTKTTSTDMGGYFSFDSIPIGNHDLQIIYLPDSDTLKRFVSVLPKSSVYASYYLSSDVWGGISLPTPIAYWPLDETSGTTAHDATGNGYDGTLVNMDPATDWVTGKIDGALDFDGSNDYVDIGTALSPVTNFTITAWVKSASVGINQQIISKGKNGSKTQWELKTISNNGEVVFQRRDGGYSGVQSQQQLTAGTWVHLAGSYDGSEWRIYWNGVLDSTATGADPVETTSRLFIGALDDKGNVKQFWHGLIDDVRIYNQVLTPAEIQVLYNMGL